MANNRTRVFNGTYTSKDGKTHKLNVRIYKRFASLILAMVIVPETHGVIVNTVENKSIKTKSQKDKPEDLKTIDRILSNNPYILDEVTKGEYTVKVGDTLNGIAESCGNTLDRISSLNNLNPRDVVLPGQKIKTETIKSKTETEKNIAALESYFNDYLFNSPVAELAKNCGTNKDDEGTVYRSLLYGNPPSEYELDPTSIYGRFVNSYLAFRRRNESEQESEKSYISVLEDLANETYDNLTRGGKAETLVPYSKYRIYLENKTTEYDEKKYMHR